MGHHNTKKFPSGPGIPAFGSIKVAVSVEYGHNSMALALERLKGAE